MKIRFKIGEDEYKSVELSEIAALKEEYPHAQIAPQEENMYQYNIGDTTYDVQSKNVGEFLLEHSDSDVRLVSSPKTQIKKHKSKVNLDIEGFQMPTADELRDAANSYLIPGFRQEERLTKYLSKEFEGTGVRFEQDKGGAEAIKMMFGDQTFEEGIPFDLTYAPTIGTHKGVFPVGSSTLRENVMEDILKAIKHEANPEEKETDYDFLVSLGDFKDFEGDESNIAKAETYDRILDMFNYGTTNRSEIAEKQNQLIEEGTSKHDIPLASWQGSMQQLGTEEGENSRVKLREFADMEGGHRDADGNIVHGDHWAKSLLKVTGSLWNLDKWEENRYGVGARGFDGLIELPSGDKISLNHIWGIRKDLLNVLETKRKRDQEENPENVLSINGNNIWDVNNAELVFDKDGKVDIQSFYNMAESFKRQTTGFNLDGSKKIGTYFPGGGGLDFEIKQIQTQVDFLEDGKLQINDRIAAAIHGFPQTESTPDKIPPPSPPKEALLALLTNAELKLVELLKTKLPEVDIKKRFSKEYSKSFQSGDIINIDDEDLINELIKTFEDRKKEIEKKEYPHSKDEEGVKIIPPTNYDEDTGMFLGVQEEELDLTKYVNNGDGTATNVDTGEVILVGVESDAEEMANTIHLDILTKQLVNTYFDLTHSTKLTAEEINRSITRERNPIWNWLSENFEQEKGGNVASMESITKQMEEAIKTDNIFELAGEDGLTDVLTTIAGGSNRAKNHNRTLHKFMTLLRAVDLNQDISQIPQQELKTEFWNSAHKDIFGNYWNNEYTDDQAYEAYNFILKEEGFQVPDHEIDGWYGREEYTGWKNLTGRQASEFASSTLTSLVPLLASLYAGNKMLGFTKLNKLAKLGVRGNIAQGGMKVGWADRVARKLVGRDASKFSKWLAADVVAPGVLMSGSWAFGETIGQGILGGRNQEQWKASTISWNPDGTIGDTRLLFPFVMGGAPAILGRVTQGMEKALLKHGGIIGRVYARASELAIAGPTKTALSFGIGQPTTAVGYLTLAESVQLIGDEVLSGKNPFDFSTPHGKHLKEEWNSMLHADKVIGTAMAMMVLHGKGFPKATYRSVKQSVRQWRGYTDATKVSSGVMGLKTRDWNDNKAWDQSEVNRKYEEKKNEIENDKKLSEAEKLEKLEELKNHKQQVEHHNNVADAKQMAKDMDRWNDQLVEDMLNKGVMERIQNGRETDADLIRAKDIKPWEFKMLAEKMGLGVKDGAYKNLKSYWDILRRASEQVEWSDIKETKGTEDARLTWVRNELAIQRAGLGIRNLEKQIEENPNESDSFQKSQIKMLEKKQKTLEKEREKLMNKFNANWNKMFKQQFAADKLATKEMTKGEVVMDGMTGKKFQEFLKKHGKKIGDHFFHEKHQNADAVFVEELVYGKDGKIKLDKYGVPVYKTKILVNTTVAMKTKNLGVGMHELSHYVLRNSLKEIRTNKDGTKEKVLSKEGILVIEAMLDKLDWKDRKIVEDRIEKYYKYETKVVEKTDANGVKYKETDYVYEKNSETGEIRRKAKSKEAYYEEYITVLGDAMKNGKIKKKMSYGRKLSKLIYPILMNPNNFKGFKEKHGRAPLSNLYKFDINQSNSGKAARDLLDMISEMSSKGITKEIRDAANANGFKITNSKEGEWKDGVLIKPSISDFMNPKPILEKITHGPKKDSKGKIMLDEKGNQIIDVLYKGADGKPSHKLFVESGAFKAGEILMKHSSLEPMITARMTGETAVLNKQQMIDFIASVKMELLERYKGGPKRDSKGRIMLDENGDPIMRTGYRYDGNPSIFGWLTNHNRPGEGSKSSIMYHAKGDVMNKWKEVNKLPTISLETPVADNLTLGDKQYAEDKDIKSFEDQDISISARSKAKRAKNEVEYSKLKAQFNLDNTNVQRSGVVKDFIKDRNFDITGVIIESPIGKNKTVEIEQYIPLHAKIIVEKGQLVKTGEPLTEGSRIVQEFKNEVFEILADRSTPDFRSKKLTAMLKDGKKTVKEGRIGEIKVVEDKAYLEFKEFEKEFNNKLEDIEKEFNSKIESAFDKLEFDKSDKLTDLKKQKIKDLKDYRRSLEYGLNYNMPIFDVKTGRLVFEKTLSSYEVSDLLFKEGDVVKKGETLVRDIKTHLEKAYGRAFRERIQKMFGVEKLYDNFIKSESMEAIWEKMTPEALQKLERLVPQELRKFTTRRRIKDKETVDKLISNNIFPKGTDYRTGPWLTEKASVYPGAEVMSAFFRGINMKKVLGVEVTSSQIGNRKAALALEVAEIMGLDATMEVLQQTRTVEAREHIRELTSREQLDNQLAILNSKINRSSSLKFSKSIKHAEMISEKINKTSLEEVIEIDKNGRPKLIENIGKEIISQETIEEVVKWYMDLKIPEATPEKLKASLFTDPDVPLFFKEMMLTQGTLNKKNPELLKIQKDYLKKAAIDGIGPEMLEIMGLDVVGLQNRIYDPAGAKKYKGWDKFSDKEQARLLKENPKTIDSKGYILENGKRVSGEYHDFKLEIEAGLKEAKRNPKNIENAKFIRLYNSKIGLMKKLEKILNLSEKDANGKEKWTSEKKRELAEKKYGKEIREANEANIKAYTDMIVRLVDLVKLNHKTGGEKSKEGIGFDTFYHLFQAQSSLVKGFRALSRLELIDFRSYPQGGWRYKNKEGKWEYTFNRGKAVEAWMKSNPKLTEQQAIEKAINTENLLLKEATKHYKKEMQLSESEARQEALKKINTTKGEHMDPNANLSGEIIKFMLDVVYNGKYKSKAEMETRLSEILEGHTQLYTNEYVTDIIDIPGKTSKEKLNRLKALDMFAPEGKHMDNIFSVYGETAKAFLLRKNLTSLERRLKEEALINKQENITKDKVSETSIKFSKSGEKRGMSTFDFDDTLAFTKSGIRTNVPNPSGLPKPKRKVIFMAGGAGSGKGNVVNKLNLEQQGFKIVNQDISLEWLKKNSGLPEDMRDFTKEQKSALGKLGHQARGIAKRKMMKFQGNAEGVVIDGTGGSIKMMEKLVTEFKEKGYDVSMMFVETTLKTALARNKARKERSLLDFIVRKNHEAVQGNKPGFKEMFGERFMEIKTDNLTMESPMPKELVDKMNDFVRGYERRRLDAEQFALEGESILQRGGKFDFTEFNKVIEGKEGPYLKTAIERAKKFGTKDMFVLTARPPESVRPIQEFLKEMGLEIPIENITGLGNSAGNAKAKWMLEKFAEGYNDLYFVDDALPNVEAVKKVLDQLDAKSKVVQAKVKFSKSIDVEFNDMLDRRGGITPGKKVSKAEAKIEGKGKGRWDLYVPPSAEDFKGLMQKNLGKGEQGTADQAFIKKVLLDPFNKGMRNINITKQKMSEEYSTLKKKSKDVNLKEKVSGTNFTNDLAIRTYLWEKAGYEVPDMSKAEKKLLLDHVNNSPKLIAFAETLGAITRLKEGYSKPNEYWMLDNIASDLNTITRGPIREKFLKEWIENKNILFSEKNLNKMEFVHGSGYREALENMLYRMEHGTNRLTERGQTHVNKFYDWINGAVGATMFWNTRSAMLQTISTVNYIDWGGNNIFKAAKAFANQPQYWKDFSHIFNSPTLKQRRAGLEIDVSASELTNVFDKGGKSPKAILNWFLQKGFTPTRIADSFAIASGGATFYRNRINTYIKEGMSKAKAEKRAWLDFLEKTEETQQSARPDFISQQQAGPLGRIILPWQNTPMQMVRIQKKSLSDLINRRRNPGQTQAQSDFSNISRILYYGAIQNVWFYALQSGLMWSMWGDDQEQIKKQELRVVNGAFDTLLRGTGIYGAAVSTVKNVILEWNRQSKKDFGKRDDSKIVQEMINLSPVLGSKNRKIMNAIKTWQYNEGVGKELGFRIENPNLHATANIIEGVFNIPIARTVNKANNLEEALTGNHKLWQRTALVGGWYPWNVGVKDEELEKAKTTVKAKKEERKKEDKKQKSIDKKIEINKRILRGYGDLDNDGIKEYQCTGITKSGKRCRNWTENKSKRCYAH